MTEVERTKHALEQALDARGGFRLNAIKEVDRMFAPIIAQRMREYDDALWRAANA